MLEVVAVTATLMLSPGPANVAALALSARHGLVRVVPFLLGIALVAGSVALVVASLGPGIVGSESYGVAPAVLQTLGGLFLAWLGTRLVARDSGWAPRLSEPSFASGALLQVLNPKYPAVVLTLMSIESDTPLLGRAGVLILIGNAAMLLYASVGAFAHQRASDRATQRRLDIGFGALMIATGGWLALRAWV